MLTIKHHMLYFLAFNILGQIQSLVELPAGEDNEIANTESIIRNTVNSLFFSLKLKRVKHKARLNDFSTIHNIFASITLLDHDNLKEITRLVKVNNIDITIQRFITQLNEVLNEDDKKHETIDDVHVSTYIETFLRKLEYLKYKHGLSSNVRNFNVNAEIIKHLKTVQNDLRNATTEIEETNDSDRNLLSDNEFWHPSGRRVYNSHRVKIRRFPFIASVQFFKKFQCGGTIIKSDLVITSASCLQLAWNNRFFRENPAFLSVQVGCNFYEGGEENIPILEVYFHPEYNPKNLANNLALMRLRRRLKFGKKVTKVKKIDFDRDPWPLPQTTDGITIIGWGARGTSNIVSNAWSNRLGFAVLDFYPLRECQDVYSKEYVTYKNFCAGFFSKGGGACNRDAGGPGVAHGILVGVVSFGSPNCGAPDAPTVFTKLGYYTDWIEEIMEQEVPNAPARTTEKPRTVSLNFNEFKNTKVNTPFKLDPIVDPRTTTEVVLIKDVEPLRTIDETALFKEFITTMFDSEEVKQYLEQPEDESDTELQESIQKVLAAVSNEITIANVKLTTQSTIVEDDHTQITAIYKRPDKEESVKVTALDNFNRLKNNQYSVTVSDDLTRYTALDAEKEEDSSTEQNIAKLINEIDIQDLLKSESSEETANTEKEKKDTSNIAKEGLVKLSESEEVDGSSSSEYEEPIDPLVNVLSESENKTIEKEELDAGLSIPKESFKDFTFRQNTSIINLFSYSDLMKLLNEAVIESERNKKSFTVTQA